MGVQSACQNMFIKAVSNLDEGWVITEEDDGFSAVESIFCNISLEFCIIRHKKPRLKIGATCYI